MPKCEKIAVFPQFPGQPTCWFNAIVMAVMFSEYSRNMLLANQDKWSDMSPTLRKLLQRFLHKKTRSVDHNFFMGMHPVSLLGHLHKENPGEFYMNKPGGHDTQNYLPRFYNFLGAKKSVHFFGITYDDKVDLLLNGVHDYITTSQRENGKFAQQYQYKEMLWQFFKTFRLEDDYDFFTLRIDDEITFTIAQRAMLTATWRVIKGVPMSKIITDDAFVLGKGRYFIDSVIWGNEPPADACLSGGHYVAGITCDQTRYAYNGYTMRHLPSFPLYKFDWVNDTSCIEVQPSLSGPRGFAKCNDSTPYEKRFSADQGTRTYVFVNERYRTPPSPTPPIKIVNPSTNRYVNIDGKIGKQIVSQLNTYKKRK